MSSLIILISLFISVNSNPRIIGGKTAKITDYPYQASLRLNSKHICGGAIISTSIVISAAHCVQTTGAYSVQLGTEYIDKSSGEVIHVNTALVHPQYQERLQDFDVCLLFLAQNITFNAKIKSVQLPEKNVELRSGAVGKVSGWGLVRDGAVTISRWLMAVEIPVWEKQQCEKVYEGLYSERMFCAGPETGHRDACQGDSGGPFVVGDVLYGLISFGYGCGDPKYPGVYTNLPKVRDFIKEYAGF